MIGVTFHAYPGPRRNPNLRRKWINQVFREEKYVPKRHHRVCSLHFVDGYPTKDNPVPTLFPRNNFGEEPPTKRSKTSIEKRQVLKDITTSKENVTMPAVTPIKPFMVNMIEFVNNYYKFYKNCNVTSVYNIISAKKADHSYSALPRHFPEYHDMTVQTNLSVADIDKMESESTTYTKGNVLLDLFVKKATSTDASVRKYFGLPSIALLLGIFNILQDACSKLKYWSGAQSRQEKRYERENHKKPGPNRKLTLFQEYLLTLLRIDLAVNTHILSVSAHSGFLDKISPGDEVMADRGFVIADYLLERKAKLIMPPFTRKCSWGKGKRLTPAQIQRTREIAKLRIHVERAIQRLKCFRILSGILPLSLKPLANKILVIAAFLCNLAPPLVKN
ncbi:hypothetical protein FSP39_010734 [Pinctada imbricata]|uniref:THAP-type domain-containing protein n=1 Tax=Pinctada imbricata TaxID=66713 RepID=A0AA88Y3G8_PINIB|nr:hypothetical protein FSP39_010734 [Pinctada imbricata]